MLSEPSRINLYRGIVPTSEILVSIGEIRNHMLGKAMLTSEKLAIADYNSDGIIDVGDILALINNKSAP